MCSKLTVASLAIALLLPSTFADDVRSISVSGRGKIEVEPDIAMVRLSVVEVDADLSKAKQLVDRKFTAVRDAIKSSGIETVDVRVTPHEITHHYSEAENGVYSVTAYEVKRTVYAKLSSTVTVSAFLDKAVLAGANRVRNVEFLSSRELELRGEAMQKAIADSKERAAEIAAGFDAKVGRPLKIETESNESFGGALYSVEVVESNPESAPTITIESKIDVVFELTE